MTETLDRWSNEQVIRFINAYKERRMLWDPNHVLYREQRTKYEAWCELAGLLGYEITDLRKKLNSILASHRRESVKIRTGRKKRSTWFAYEYLNFLPNHLSNEENNAMQEKFEKTDSEDPMDEEHLEETAEEENEEYDENGSTSPVHIIVKQDPEDVPISPPKYFRPVKPSSISRINKMKLVKHRLRKLADKKKIMLESKLLKESKSNAYNGRDECESFGEYIAISLRKHDERTRSMIKQAINNILFEQEMKKYNSGQYTVIYSGEDVNPLIIPDDCEK